MQLKIVKIISFAEGVAKILGVSVSNEEVTTPFNCIPLTTLTVGDTLIIPTSPGNGAMMTSAVTYNPVAIYIADPKEKNVLSFSKELEAANKEIFSLVMKKDTQPVTDMDRQWSRGVRRGEAIVFGGGNTGSGYILNDDAKAADIPEPPEVAKGLKVYMEAFSVITSDLIKIIMADVNRTVAAANLLTYINWGTQLIQPQYEIVFTSNVIPFDLNLVGLETLRLRIQTYLTSPTDYNLLNVVDEIHNFIERLPHAKINVLSKQI